jgi:predicted HicB family RNase H-like nuclease
MSLFFWNHRKPRMKYKGYIGHIVYDDKAKIFHGEVIGLKDVITFQGSSVKELEEAFKDSVEDYLGWSKTLSLIV